MTDKEPRLATCSLLPVIRTFIAPAGVEVRSGDISVAGCILAEFSGHLAPDQRVPDVLAEPGRMLKVVLDYDAIEALGAPMSDAINRLKIAREKYDLQVLAAFENSMQADEGLVVSTVSIMQIDDSMIVAEDLKTAQGVLLIAKGQETTLSVRHHLQKYRDNGLIGNEVKGSSLRITHFPQGSGLRITHPVDNRLDCLCDKMRNA